MMMDVAIMVMFWLIGAVNLAAWGLLIYGMIRGEV